MNRESQSSKIVIEITQEELDSAAENLEYYLREEAESSQVEIDTNELRVIVQNALESRIEDILLTPEEFLSTEELDKANNCVTLPSDVVRRQLDLDIPA